MPVVEKRGWLLSLKSPLLTSHLTRDRTSLHTYNNTPTNNENTDKYAVVECD